MNRLTIAEMIPIKSISDKNILLMWNTVIGDLTKVAKPTKVYPVLCHRYVYDFYGLLLNLNIPYKYLYPTLRVNGYSASTEYTGNVKDVLLIPEDILTEYYSAFTRK